MTEEKAPRTDQKNPSPAAGCNNKGHVHGQSEGRAGTVKKDDNHAAQVLKDAKTELTRQRVGTGTVALVAARGGGAGRRGGPREARDVSLSAAPGLL